MRIPLHNVWLCLFFQLSNSGARAQQAPVFQVDKFDTSLSHRTNVCERQRSVWNGTVALPDSLKGLQLTTVITNYIEEGEKSYFTLDADGKIKAVDPGLFAVVLDEVARRAGFSWRDSFAAAGPLNSTTDGNRTWSDILSWGVEVFDISMEKWGRSLDRMEAGISFPTGWWDSSIVLAERVQEQERVVNLWSFLSPFRPSVWFTILASILLTGLLYWFMEYIDVDADERNLEDKPGLSIFYMCLIFTGHFELRPKTNAARLICWSWCFWGIVVASSYTANMASFLVTPQVDVYRIGSMEAAMRQNANICVQAGGVVASILYSKYGQDIQLVGQDTELDIYLGLREGRCEVVAHQMNSFGLFEKHREANLDCTLESERRVLHVVPAGMATAVDTGVRYCTSLIYHVLDYHLTQMQADGFIEKAWRFHLSKTSTIECIKEPPRQTDFGDAIFALGLQDMGGIFILHGIVLVFSLLLAFYQFFTLETSDKSLSEIFFLKQAREQIRMSIDSNNMNNQQRQNGRERQVLGGDRLSNLNRNNQMGGNTTTTSRTNLSSSRLPGLEPVAELSSELPQSESELIMLAEDDDSFVEFDSRSMDSIVSA